MIFSAPGVKVSRLLCAQGWGIRPLKKFPGDFSGGGGDGQDWN